MCARARSKTVFKSYVCDVSSTILSSFLAPQRGFWINCNTTRPRNSEVRFPGVVEEFFKGMDSPARCVRCSVILLEMQQAPPSR